MRRAVSKGRPRPQGSRVGTFERFRRDGPVRASRNDQQPSSTSRKDGRAEAVELRLDRLRSVLDLLPIGVVVCEAGGRVIDRNKSAMDLMDDYQANALVQAAVERVLSADDLEAKAGEVVEIHGPTSKTVTLHAESLYDGGKVVLITDTSERRRIDALRRDFVANVSHELRTPVGAIVLLAETLAEETDPGAVALLNKHISSEARRAERLVEELLRLSRVEGPQIPRREDVEVSELVDEARQRVAPKAGQRDISIKTKYAPEIPPLWADREELLSAVINLLDNAVKYSGDGGAVEIGVEVDENSRCRIDVRDSGIGIPAKDLDRVFERFYRVDQARSRETGGAGLGLSIVRHVAENHGGSVTVTSREGEGSTFTLTLQVLP